MAFSISVAMFGFSGAYPVVCVLAVSMCIGALATRLAGGVTGDTHGAAIEISEAATLLLIGALANRGWMLDGLWA
jgi:cobalamin synthase